MAKRNNRGRGSGGGRGGRGGGRGGRGFGGRGRGRGGGGGGGGGGRGNGIGYVDDFDFPVQQWSERSTNNAPRGFASPRGGGRGGANNFSHPGTPNRGGYNTPRGRGRGIDDSPLRGRGRFAKKLMNKNAPLSQLLYEDRPYLKPIVFVRSQGTPTLFNQQEDILQPLSEDVAESEESHVPTASRVFDVFNHRETPFPISEDEENQPDAHGDEEELEEIDFSDMGRLREEIDAIAVEPQETTTQTQTSEVVEESNVEDELFYVDTNPTSARARRKAEKIIVDQVKGAIPLGSAPAETQHWTQLRTTAQSTTVEEPQVEKPPTGFYIDTDPTTAQSTTFEESQVEEPPTGFYIDTNPTLVQEERIQVDRVEGVAPLGERFEDDDDEEVIVYVAPHPRTTATPKPPEATLPIPPAPITSAIATATKIGPIFETEEFNPPPPDSFPESIAPDADTLPNVSSLTFDFASKTPSRSLSRQYATTPQSLISRRAHPRARQRTKKGQERRAKGMGLFGMRGAEREEREMRGIGNEEEEGEGERRRGSDIEWGDEDEVEEGAEGAEGAEGMQADVEIDVKAMQRFVSGVGRGHVTMDDLEDEERMRREDEEGRRRGEESGSSEEEEGDDEETEAVFEHEENVLVAESHGGPVPDSSSDEEGEEEEESESEEDIEETPRRGFQARLAKMREWSKGKSVVDDPMALAELEFSGEEEELRTGVASLRRDDASDEEDDDEDEAHGDEDLMAVYQAFIEENDDILNGRSSREQKEIFRAVSNGHFSDLEEFTQPRRKKDKDVPPELRDQWNRDRAKKAQYKRDRAQARLEAAADLLTPKKGGKKSRKAIMAAARLDPSIEIPNRVVDLPSLEQQIRRFLSMLDGPNSMALPPCDKQTRKAVHELALAFGLKSESKGKGAGRYTTLYKTTRSGVTTNESKVRRVMNQFAPRWSAPGGGGGGGKGKRVPTGMPHHKEGDEVGKTAPKIDGSNVGFRMLASMGWSEGDRIGLSGGLEAPLAAVYKKTKLGLGATL